MTIKGATKAVKLNLPKLRGRLEATLTANPARHAAARGAVHAYADCHQ